VPGDLLDGEPLKYRRTKTGYVLYSVGWNEKDDGGTTAMSTDKKAPGLDLDEGDWVWPYRPRSKVVDG
jgi:hypothetical protein